MRKITVVSLAAFAALAIMANVVSNVAINRGGMAAHAQTFDADKPAAVWLVTATIKDADGDEVDVLYFRQSDPERRFADEAACKVVLAGDDGALKSANDGLKVQVVQVFGEGTTVEFSCSVEPSE